jgi:hypothetical protein
MSELGKRLRELREEYIAAGGRLYTAEEIALGDGWEFAGTVGVDGGHVLIGDANYAKHLSEDWSDKTHHGNYDVNVHDGVARVFFGMAGGVVCASGNGDGCYRVFVKRDGDGKRITHMQIDFTESDYNA